MTKSGGKTLAVMLRALLSGFLAAACVAPAWSEVCYYKIESLDFDRLRELFPDLGVIEDPNFRSIGDAEFEALANLIDFLGYVPEDMPPGLYVGSAGRRGIWYRKGPCDVRSVEELADFYSAPYTSGLTYNFEKIDHELFERAVGPSRLYCDDCYSAATDRE
ncbi:MAG: hypothetical protein WA989_13700 [Henriciella sp.]|uniref:hypothetical protein n=1 Tax=Henriciella sp. TaxID=1968823 RepID=UPI003C73F47A